jgi:hypothetical protein
MQLGAARKYNRPEFAILAGIRPTFLVNRLPTQYR